MSSSTFRLKSIFLPANRSRYVISAAGLALILAGLLISSGTLLGWLRPEGAAWSRKLLLGATYFRSLLVVLGLITVIGSWIPWPGNKPAAQTSADEGLSGHVAYRLLGILLLAATAMRFYGLNRGLWLDEILTYIKYARLPLGTLVTTYSSENQHFLYSILASASFSVFGESGWVLRLPAVLFGLGSLLALYLFGLLVSNRREALLATALLTFSYHHVWFSQNARGYTGLLFWTLLASWLFLWALRDEKPRLWILYAFAAALGVYTHLTMLFVIFGHGTIYLLELFRRRQQPWPSRWQGVVLGLGLSGVLTLLLYSLVLPQMLDGAAASESVVDTWKNPLWTLLEFVRGLQIGFSSTIVVGGAVALFGAGLWKYVQKEYAVVLLMFVPSLVGAAVTVAVGHHLWPRFFFFTFGFGALVVVKGVHVVTDWGVRLIHLKAIKASDLSLILSLGMILVSAISVPLAYGPKQDYDSALAFVADAARPDDAIVSVGLAGYVYENFYDADWVYLETRPELDAVRADAGAVWMVYSFVEVIEAVQPEILTAIENECTVVGEFPGSVPAGTVMVCKFESP